MIHVEGVTKSFRKAQVVTDVLRGVSFRVEPGDYVAIMGPSGSGKTTLMNILGFLDRPDGGRYLFEGVDLSGADDDRLSALRNRRIGFVFQQFHLLERASALENVNLPLLYADGDVGDVEGRGRSALDAVGLSHRAGHFPGELSGGEQQRVAIARALINDPAVVLADEPTGNLDAASGSEVLGLFAGLHARGRTLVVITHEEQVAARAERILELRDGRIVGERAGRGVRVGVHAGRTERFGGDGPGEPERSGVLPPPASPATPPPPPPP
jgi:putative ABC transport system ATP-binding protein